MTTLADLPMHDGQESAATPTGAKGRKACRRHGTLLWDPDAAEWRCEQCGKPVTIESQRRGRNNRIRGLAIQRDIARRLGLVNLHGPLAEDAKSEETYCNAAFVAQVKSGARFPGWMATELAKLPRTGGRVPLLAIAETPGAGHRRRAIVVVDLEDWVDLHGPSGDAA
jgi:hypothetical protein